jgi:penicillin-binding protein 2
MSTLERAHTPDPRLPVSPQLGVRVAILGGFALVMFGIIFFRLWYLQILTGEQYVQKAAANTTREVPIPAPRGQILGREGELLVTSRVTNAVQIIPSELPPRGPRRRALYRRLGHLLGMTPARIVEVEQKGLGELPYAPVTIKTDAGRGVLTVLGERQNEYPGVTQEPISVRYYPDNDLAAQIFGYVRPLSEEQLKHAPKAFKDVKAGTMVGQSGLEYYYDQYLRGTPGVQPVEVNAEGQVVPARPPVKAPVAGYSLRTTLDLGLQHAGEAALRTGMELARGNGNPGNAGAFLAMDPRNGQILAMGSNPSFNPNQVSKPLSQRELAAIEGPRRSLPGAPAPAPFTDRAAEGAYPTGSTFKPITAIASLEAGTLDPSAALGGGSCITAPGGRQFCNAGKTDYGAVGLVEALKVSSDTYFFTVGELDNAHGEVIQRMAHRLGIGRSSEVDLPSEFTGVLPSQRWRDAQNHKQEHCERHHPKNECGYVAEIRSWEPGDDMNLAVGQGDLQTNPLQMAVAYSTLANAYMNGGEGSVVTPHLAEAIENPSGGIVQALSFPPQRHIRFDAANLSLVMAGIHDATSQSGGTSADVWTGWDQAQHPVYGKTGTAERGGLVEQAWYMCYIADPRRPIVIAVTVEQGGFGDQAAAPVARLMAEQWFHQKHKLVSGSSADK